MSSETIIAIIAVLVSVVTAGGSGYAWVVVGRKKGTADFESLLISTRTQLARDLTEETKARRQADQKIDELGDKLDAAHDKIDDIVKRYNEQTKEKRKVDEALWMAVKYIEILLIIIRDVDVDPDRVPDIPQVLQEQIDARKAEDNKSKGDDK